MNNIIGHIVGMDELHKNRFIKKLPSTIKPIDLDDLQQQIYNCQEIIAQKKSWSDISNQIIILKKQNKLVKMCQNNSNNTLIESEIKHLLTSRKGIKKNIYDIWKSMMTAQIDKLVGKYNDYRILFIGFNIYPKDYRVKVNLPLIAMPKGSTLKNKIICDMTATVFASGQIKHYIRTYHDRIIRGVFPLELLKHAYLCEKHDKFVNYYKSNGYYSQSVDQLMNVILQLDNQLNNQLIMINAIDNNYVYVATLFKSADVIPASPKTPIIGFVSLTDAKQYIKKINNSGGPVYIYTVSIDQFQLIDGKMISTNPIFPMKEESIILT